MCLQIYKLYQRAFARGFNPDTCKIVKVEHVQDDDKSGRLKCSQVVVDLILKTVIKDRQTRQQSSQAIANEVSKTPGIASVSASTVWRVLTAEGFRLYKRIFKPGLTKDNRIKRLRWCEEHSEENRWTLERWKNVIWTNKTSVQLQSVRGKRRVQRKPDEEFIKDVIIERWKGFSEFIQWSAFSWDFKSPPHIQKPETIEEKKAAKVDLTARNTARIAQDEINWRMATGMRRMGLRGIGGVRPTFRHTEETGAYIRKATKGGIDQYK